MKKEYHVEYLESLKNLYGKGLLSFPKREGAFYFGEILTYDEYVDKYEEECVKRGWITE